MVFAAQIRLEEVAPFDVDRVLPKKGLLSFFIDWAGASDAKVFHFDELDELERLAPLKVPELGRTPPDKPCAVKFATEISLPQPGGNKQLEALDLDDEEQDGYNDDLWMEHRPRSKTRFPVTHYMLGYSHCDYNDSQDPKSELLLQIDTDDAAGLQWGDAQAAYVFIAKTALAKGEMKKAWHGN